MNTAEMKVVATTYGYTSDDKQLPKSSPSLPIIAPSLPTGTSPRRRRSAGTIVRLAAFLMFVVYFYRAVAAVFPVYTSSFHSTLANQSCFLDGNAAHQLVAMRTSLDDRMEQHHKILHVHARIITNELSKISSSLSGIMPKHDIDTNVGFKDEQDIYIFLSLVQDVQGRVRQEPISAKGSISAALVNIDKSLDLISIEMTELENFLTVFEGKVTKLEKERDSRVSECESSQTGMSTIRQASGQNLKDALHTIPNVLSRFFS